MKVVTRGKKPFAGSPLLRVCLGLTLAGLALTMNSMVRPNGLSFTLFSVVGTPLMLLSVAMLLYLFLDDMRKRGFPFDKHLQDGLQHHRQVLEK